MSDNVINKRNSNMLERSPKIILLLLLIVIILTGTNLLAIANTVPIFDALIYKAKPDLSQYGLKKIFVIYDSALWNTGERQRDTLNIPKIISIAKTIPPNSLVCIDIEDWPLKGSTDVVTRSIIKYKTVARLFKENCPTAKIGFYGILPLNDYWPSVKGKGSKEYDAWVRQNIILTEIAETVDIIFPSLYTFYPDQKGWETYAKEHLKEARKYGKPVYAFIWPEYHDSNRIYKGQSIPADFWRFEHELINKYADGIVIWGGWQKYWDENAAWWNETKKFIRDTSVK
jgi:hypothetical protein